MLCVSSALKPYAFKIVVKVSTDVVTSVNPPAASFEDCATKSTASAVDRPAEIA